MNLFLILIICGVVVYFGYLFTKHYNKKVQIFLDMSKFCTLLESEIRFTKNSIKNIIAKNLQMFCPEFVELLNHFVAGVGLTSAYLNKSECNIIESALKSLGKFDVEGEVNNLNRLKLNINQAEQEISKKNIKIGGLGIKLGIIGALLLFIILI